MSQTILNYTANGALHHLLHGIKSLISGSTEASCTWSQLQTWARPNPCAEAVDLKTLVDKLATDLHIEVIATGSEGLSAGTHTNSRVKMLGSGMLMLSRLNIKRAAPPPKGCIAGRKAALDGITSPLDRAPASRAGSEDFRKIPSRSGDQAKQYDSAQGMGKAA